MAGAPPAISTEMSMRDTVFVARRRSDDKSSVVTRTTNGRSSMQPEIAAAFRRLTGAVDPPEIVSAVAAVAGVAGATGDPRHVLDALVVLHWAQSELAAIEPELIRAARAAGVSWQALAPALGVASRQAAE